MAQKERPFFDTVYLCNTIALIFLIGGIALALLTAPDPQAHLYATGESPTLSTYLPTIAVAVIGAGLAVLFYAIGAIVRASEGTREALERLEGRRRKA